jgi:AraC-like DNA-binding protein
MEARDAYHYEDAVGLAFNRLVIDISEGQFERFHAQKTPDANVEMFYRFIHLLEEGHYKFHRDVAWYADQLCITPKHLSYCVKMASGRSSEYWIDSICVNNLVDSLKNHTVTEVCGEYHFSSLSYLSRYVKRLTGLSPREIR